MLNSILRVLDTHYTTIDKECLSINKNIIFSNSQYKDDDIRIKELIDTIHMQCIYDPSLENLRLYFMVSFPIYQQLITFLEMNSSSYPYYVDPSTLSVISSLCPVSLFTSIQSLVNKSAKHKLADQSVRLSFFDTLTTIPDYTININSDAWLLDFNGYQFGTQFNNKLDSFLRNASPTFVVDELIEFIHEELSQEMTQVLSTLESPHKDIPETLSYFFTQLCDGDCNLLVLSLFGGSSFTSKQAFQTIARGFPSKLGSLYVNNKAGEGTLASSPLFKSLWNISVKPSLGQSFSEQAIMLLFEVKKSLISCQLAVELLNYLFKLKLSKDESITVFKCRILIATVYNRMVSTVQSFKIEDIDQENLRAELEKAAKQLLKGCWGNFAQTRSVAERILISCHAVFSAILDQENRQDAFKAAQNYVGSCTRMMNVLDSIIDR